MTDQDTLPLEDLYDYLNGHLPPARAAEIARAAGRSPALRATIEEERARLADLKRAMPASPRPAAPATPGPRWRTAAAIALLAFGLGLGLHPLLAPGGTPQPDRTFAELIDLAAEAHSNSRLRLNLVSQVEHVVMDAAELTSATGIRIPPLPEGWTLRDVQVYPSPYGPSIEIAVNTADNGLISIYAVRVGDTRTVLPVPHDTDSLISAVFQVDRTAYVLLGTTAPAPLDDEAGELFRRLL